MAGGRPTKLTPEIQAKADDYIRASAEELGEAIPSAAGLAVYIGVGKRTLYDWAESNEEFSHTLKDINAAQEQKALNGGMSNQYNATITKLVLANHGYSDKQEIDNRSSDGTMTPAPAVQVTESTLKGIVDKL